MNMIDIFTNNSNINIIDEKEEIHKNRLYVNNKLSFLKLRDLFVCFIRGNFQTIINTFK